jgi:hypothetical protein
MSLKVEFTRQLLERLWDDYAERVPYARTYQQMLAELGGKFVNDHIAYRSLALNVGAYYLGISNVRRIFDALEFKERGRIDFPDQKLFAHYVQHAEPDFPKIFVSELKVNELPGEVAQKIREAVDDYSEVLSDADVKAIDSLRDGGTISDELLERTFRFFRQVPWSPPPEDTVQAVNAASQYGAWVLLHGYNVNHFTGYVNRHGIKQASDIESLVDELKKRGVPMKPEIEGQRGSKLRQTSTEAVRVPVKVRGADGSPKEIEWTYAYMEYAERGEVEENGKRVLFEGFLGPQATQLFDMTRVK